MKRPSGGEPDWQALLIHFQEGFSLVGESIRSGLRELVKSACDTVHSAESSLMVPTADGGHLRFFVSVNEELESGSFTVPRDESLAGYVFHTGQMVAVDEPDDYYREIDDKVGTRTREYLAVPILHDVTSLGVLTFINRPEGSPAGSFTKEEIERAQSFATLAAVGLRLYQRIDLQLRLAEAELSRAGESLCPGAGVPATRSAWMESEADEAPIVRVLESMKKFEGNDQEFLAELVEMVAKRLESGSGRGFTFETFRE